jgi:hypothetical protein
MAAIEFRNIGLYVGPTKVVIFRTDRPDLSHLTCSWDNFSGEVDVHLTPVSPRNEDDRDSILKIQEPELQARLRDLLRQILEFILKNPIEVIWAVQPQWLRKRGYLLVGPSDEPVSLWLQRALTKRRGKHRLDERALKQSPKMAPYKPTARRLAQLGQDGQVSAVSVKGPYRGTRLELARLDLTSSSPTWVAVNRADMANLIKAAKRSRFLPQWFASLAPEAWERINKALQLHEVGL